MLRSDDFLRLSAVLMMEYIRTPDGVEQHQQWMTQSESGLVRWMTEAIADERLKDVDVHIATTQFLGLIKSFAFWPQVTMHAPVPEGEERERIVDSAVTLFLDHYQVG